MVEPYSIVRYLCSKRMKTHSCHRYLMREELNFLLSLEAAEIMILRNQPQIKMITIIKLTLTIEIKHNYRCLTTLAMTPISSQVCKQLSEAITLCRSPPSFLLP